MRTDMKKGTLTYTILSIMTIAVLIFSSGCGSNSAQEEGKNASGETRTIQHELGSTEVKGDPKKIVVLEFSFLDSLTALGVTPVGVADDKKPQLIEKLAGKKIDYTSVGTRAEPNIEIISSLQPDLIIADAERHKGIYEQLKKVAPTIELKSKESTYKENIDAFKTISDALNKKEASDKRLKEHDEVIEKIKADLPKEETRKVMVGVARTDSFNIHTSSSYDGEILANLGLKNSVESPEAYKDINLEQLSELNPDILFVSSNEGKTIVDDWKQNPIWKDLKAVKNNQVYDVDRDLWTRFRGVMSSETISKDVTEKVYSK
ncbi:ABC transporter substrate-binding protein [Bacillus gobiensis]|uniref:ABC transporter substrate-binding protein n=1 Tax=Bacillus gobiensis TaxID=1441095 RepID=UPI003D1F3CFB